MKIQVMSCGGTLDKVYGTGKGVRDLHIGPPVAPGILEQMLHAELQNPPAISCQKDSLDMTENDRVTLGHMIAGSSASHILVTHGTDTLIETARALKAFADIANKRIVLVGASQPACVINSDAPARLGFALAVLIGSLEPAVIVAMDGIHTNLDTCTKDEDGIFRS